VLRLINPRANFRANYVAHSTDRLQSANECIAGLLRARSSMIDSECNDKIPPVFLSGSLVEMAFDACHNLPELTVIKSPDEDDAGMWALRLSPFTRKRREVAAVAGDEHTVLPRGKFEYRRIV
jgi:hypothetical protein